jgi:hypothetical protein
MFASDGRAGKGKHDLFVATRDGNGWSKAENLSALNTSDDDFDATFLHDGASMVYTSGDLEHAVTLYLAEFHDGHYLPRVRLPDTMNGIGPGATALGPSIAIGEQHVLYFTAVRPEVKGRADIYRDSY